MSHLKISVLPTQPKFTFLQADQLQNQKFVERVHMGIMGVRRTASHLLLTLRVGWGTRGEVPILESLSLPVAAHPHSLQYGNHLGADR